MSLFDDLLSDGRQAQWNELQEVSILYIIYIHISKFVEGGGGGGKQTLGSDIQGTPLCMKP